MRFSQSLKTLSPIAMLAVLSSGCATFGLIYEDVGTPPFHVLPQGRSGWDENLNASTGGRELVKRGVACSQDILKLVAWGDGTQAAAARQGGITEVVGLDFENTAILGIVYTKNCTVVYGTAAPPTAPAPPPPPAAAAPQPAPAQPMPEQPAPAPPAPASSPEDSVAPAPATTPAAPDTTTAPPPTTAPPAPTN